MNMAEQIYEIAGAMIVSKSRKKQNIFILRLLSNSVTMIARMSFKFKKKEIVHLR